MRDNNGNIMVDKETGDPVVVDLTTDSSKIKVIEKQYATKSYGVKNSGAYQKAKADVNQVKKK